MAVTHNMGFELASNPRDNRDDFRNTFDSNPADELAKLKAQLRIWDDDVNRYVLKAENQWQAMVALMRLWVNRPWRS